MTYPRIQIFEYLRGLCQPEVELPASKVYPHLFGNLGHALASNASGDEPDTPFERVERLRSNGNLDRYKAHRIKNISKIAAIYLQ
ncbi:hypothetical protein [Yersinia enterocolitica]|uniref:hypothetical protein n=1 Tax=Yersinia enterocolitica TaxID=630 RepID=UPI00209D0F94|nr:hypothetical protein [Yersinia enterocolitica]